MKKLIILGTTTLFLTGCASTGTENNTNVTQVKAIDTNDLSLVAENTATLTYGDVTYNLDSYIKPFQQPYYVKLARVDGKPITQKTVTSVAKKYIQPRGCTQPAKLAPQLNQKNATNTQWIIGVVC